MRKFFTILLSFIFGIVACFLSIGASNKLGIAPDFPTFAGEDDFSLRIDYFLFVLCLGFSIMGIWIGTEFYKNRIVGIWMWIGVFVGSAATFIVVWLLSSITRGISEREVANNAVLVFFICWVTVAALGALIAKAIGS